MSGRSENIRFNVYLNDKQAGNTMGSLYGQSRKLKSELNKLKIGSAAWIKKLKEVQSVEKRLSKVRAEIRGTNAGFGKMAKNFNKYFGLITAGIASLSGVIYLFKNIIKSNAELSDSFADVRKTTGLTDAEIKLLYKDLKKIDTRSANSELLNLARIAGKLGVEGKENILGFVNAADQINVALSEDLGGDPEEAIRQIGKLVDIFKIEDEFGLEKGMLKIGSAINALGASSTANEAYIVEFSKRVAGIAPNANISAANIFGLAATLDQLGQTSEVSSTVFGKLMIAIGKDVPRFAELAGMSIADFSKLLKDDANEALLTVLDAAKSTEGGVEGMAESLKALGIDGQRSAGVLGVLTKNIDLLREQQKLSNEEFNKGTSLTEEYDIKNTNLAANLRKLKKVWFEIITMPGLEKFSKNLVKGIIDLVDWIKRNTSEIKTFFKVLGILLTSLVTYKTVVAAANAKVNIMIKLTGLMQTIALRAAISYNKLTGNIGRAAAAQRVLNTATKASPWGLILGLLAAAGAAYLAFKKDVHKATDEQKKFNKAMQEGQEIITNSQTIEKRYKVVNKLSERQLSILKDDIKTEQNLISEKTAKILETYTAADSYNVKRIKELNRKIRNTNDENQKMILESQLHYQRKLLNAKIKAEQGISATEIDAKKKELRDMLLIIDSKIKEIQNIKPENPDPDDDPTDTELKKLEALNQKIAELTRSQELGKMEANKREIQLIKDKYQKLIDEAKGFDEQIKSLEELRDADILIKKAEQDQEYLDKQKELQKEIKDMTFEADVTELENRKELLEKKLELARQNGQDTIAIEKEVAAINKEIWDQKYEQELAAISQQYIDAIDQAKLYGLDTTALVEAQKKAEKIIKDKYDNLEVDGTKKKNDKIIKLDKLSKSQKLQIAASSMDAISGLFKEGSVAAKILASGSAIINTYAAATAALAPPPVGLGPIAGIPLAVSTVIAGLVNVAKINSVQFAKGGISKGASHDNGGIHMIDSKTGNKVGEMEGGEPYMILSKETYKNNRELINSLLNNSLHRGGEKVEWMKPGYYPHPDLQGVTTNLRNSKYAAGTVTNVNHVYNSTQTSTAQDNSELLALNREMLEEFKRLKNFKAIIDLDGTLELKDAISDITTFEANAGL